jgi:hypothetical protein
LIKGPSFFRMAEKNRSFNEYVRHLPADSVIFSNDASSAYLFSRRWAIRIPGKYRQRESTINAHFGESLEKIGRLCVARPVYIVFYASEQGKKLPRPEEISVYLPLRLLFEDQGQRVYEAGK